MFSQKAIHQPDAVTSKNGPLLFQITKKVKCYYCNKVKLFIEMRKHHRACHTKTPFLTINHSVKRTCGECPYIYIDKQDLVKHYKICHITNTNCVFQVPEDLRLSNNIDRYINLPVSDVFYCKICYVEAYSMNLLEEHHTISHPNATKSIEKLNRQLLLSCCNKKFATKCAIHAHVKKNHPNVLKSQLKVKTFMNKSKIIFPNGFHCEKRDIIYSTHKSEVDSFCDILQKNSVVKNDNRRNNINYGAFDNNLEGISHYGVKAEEVDLVKILTNIDIANSSVRVTCQQLSTIFKMNPKVYVEKMSLEDAKEKMSL